MHIGTITIRVVSDDDGKLLAPITSEMVVKEALEQKLEVHEGWCLIDDITALGVYKIMNGDDYINVWVVERNKRITDAIQSVTIEVEVIGGGDKPAKDVMIADVVSHIMDEAQKLGIQCDTPEESDCYLMTGTEYMRGSKIASIHDLGVYSLRLHSENDVYKKIAIWTVKRPAHKKAPEELLRTGQGDFTHYFVSSVHGSKIRKSRDDVRAHVTNEINLSNNGSYIEDIGFRFDPLEAFFRNAKAGDHTTFNVGTQEQKFMVTIIRLHNEV
jgi:hypothetical protein